MIQFEILYYISDKLMRKLVEGNSAIVEENYFRNNPPSNMTQFVQINFVKYI